MRKKKKKKREIGKYESFKKKYNLEIEILAKSLDWFA